MIYTCTIKVELPKLPYNYQDGDYHKFLKSSLSPDSYNLLIERIKKLRKDKIKFYRRFYDRSSCTTEYITLSTEDRVEIKDTIIKFLNDVDVPVSYTESEYNETVKEYIFLD